MLDSFDQLGRKRKIVGDSIHAAFAGCFLV